GRQLLKLAHSRIDPFHNGGRVQPAAELRHEGLPRRLAVHGLGEHLERDNVVVAVHDQAGEEVGLAENQPVGIGVADHEVSITQRFPDSLAKRSEEHTSELQSRGHLVCRLLLEKKKKKIKKET